MNPALKDPHKPPFNPFFALISGIIAVSTGAIFARLAGEAPSLVIAAYRVGLASLLIAPVAWWQARKEITGLARRDLILGLAAGFFLAMHFAAWISSLRFTSVANSVALVNTNPLWVGILTPLVTREKVRLETKIGIGLSVIGGIIIGAGDMAGGHQTLMGDCLALLGGLCAAFYLLLGRNLRKKLSLTAYIMVCYGSAAMILWAIVLVMGYPVSGFGAQTYAAFWAMAIVPQIIGHTSYNWSLKWFSAGTIAVSLLGEPVCAAVMAYFLFAETLTWLKITGALLILAAIAVSSLGEEKSGEEKKQRDNMQ